MPRRADFIKHLSRADYERWEAFMREPGRSIEQVHDWLCAECGLVDSKEFPTHPRRVSKTAVGDEMKKFVETDRYRAAVEMAEAIHTAAAESGTVDLAAAANLQVAQRLQTALLQAGDSLDIKSLLDAARAVNNLGQAQQRVVELKRIGNEQLEALKGVANKRQITGDDIDAVRKAVFG